MIHTVEDGTYRVTDAVGHERGSSTSRPRRGQDLRGKGNMTPRNPYNRPAPLDAPAKGLIAAVRAAPAGDSLWVKPGDALWVARNAPMDVFLRCGDLLHIPHLDCHDRYSLADEVTRSALERGHSRPAAEERLTEN